MRLLRVYHAGRDAAHRARERALVAAGVDVTLVVPASWADAGSERQLSAEPFPVVELEVRRSGDVNRHSYADRTQLRAVLADVRPDLVDLHEEPFSVAARQWLAAAAGLPAVAYTAQNVDKRLPPPFHQYEQAAFGQLRGMYPCSAQAASVARGKGFGGELSVLPLGVDAGLLTAGGQRHDDDPFVLGFVGRFVPEKGVLDAVRVLAQLHERRRTVLVLAGAGPLEAEARRLAAALGVADRIEVHAWSGPVAMTQLYRRMHVLLLPSAATQTWVEQFGRVIVEAHATGAVVAGYASGSIPEVTGVAGLLVPEGDVDALATAAAGLALDRGHWQSLREAGLQAAGPRSWDAVAAQQVRFYERALAGAPVAPRRGRPAERRRAAVAEFGPTAALAGSVTRPFALPLLRRDTAVSRALARAVDAVAR